MYYYVAPTGLLVLGYVFRGLTPTATDISPLTGLWISSFFLVCCERGYRHIAPNGAWCLLILVLIRLLDHLLLLGVIMREVVSAGAVAFCHEK